MNIKKTSLYLAAAVLMLTLSACGKESSVESSTTDTTAAVSTGETSENSTDSATSAESEDDHQTSTDEADETSDPVESEPTEDDQTTPPEESSDQTTEQLPVSDKATVRIVSVKAKPGDEMVPITVEILNNPGYTLCGIQIYYDPALIVCKDTGSENPTYEGGSVVDRTMSSAALGADSHVLAFASMSSNPVMRNGDFVTFYVNIPESAKPGTVYQLDLTVDSMNNAQSEQFERDAIGGTIEVE